MGGRDAREGPDDLREDVAGNEFPGEAAERRIRHGDHGIEVSAGYRPERQDEGDERSAGGDGVREKRDRHVPAGEPLPHDARADDGGEEKRRSQRFSDELSSHITRWHRAWPDNRRRRHRWL